MYLQIIHQITNYRNIEVSSKTVNTLWGGFKVSIYNPRIVGGWVSECVKTEKEYSLNKFIKIDTPNVEGLPNFGVHNIFKGH